MSSETTHSAGVYDFLGWLEANKQRLLWGVGAVMALALVVSFYVTQKGQREIDGSKALSDVRTHDARGMLNAGAAETYLKLAGEYSGTAAGARAALLGAGALFTEGKYSEAQAQFERFLRDYPEAPFRTQALLGVAASLDAQGKAAEATPRYKELAERYSSDPAGKQAKSALARLYEAQNKPELAYPLYEDLARSDANGTFGLEAGIRLGDLMIKYPNLAKANAPAANPPQP